MRIFSGKLKNRFWIFAESATLAGVGGGHAMARFYLAAD
jgi:hypothetical protein